MSRPPARRARTRPARARATTAASVRHGQPAPRRAPRASVRAAPAAQRVRSSCAASRAGSSGCSCSSTSTGRQPAPATVTISGRVVRCLVAHLGDGLPAAAGTSRPDPPSASLASCCGRGCGRPPPPGRPVPRSGRRRCRVRRRSSGAGRDGRQPGHVRDQGACLLAGWASPAPARPAPARRSRPSWITAISSATLCTRARLWVTNSMLRPRRRRSSSSSSMTTACTETSSADVTSSQTSSCRLHDQRAGDRNPLALAAGQLVREAAADGRAQRHAVQRIGRTRRSISARSGCSSV